MMRMSGCLRHGDDGGKAGINPVEQGAPMRLRPGGEKFRKFGLCRWPAVAIELAGEVGIVGQPQRSDHCGIKLRLERAKHDVAIIGTAIYPGERPSAISARPLALAAETRGRHVAIQGAHQ